LSHIPPYNGGSRHYHQQRDFKATAALFPGRVDWHFSGHEHLYQRMLPLVQRADRTSVRGHYGSDGGVGHIVVPPAGATPNQTLVGESASLFDRRWLAFPEVSASQTFVDGVIGFLRIDIRGNGIQLRTYGVEAEAGRSRVIDQVEYYK